MRTDAGRRRRGQAGFTLLEVLVALAILAVALSALIKLSGDNARNAAYLRDRTHAHWVAGNVMARYQAGLEPVGSSLQRGSAFMAGREWYWQAQIEAQTLELGGRMLGPIRRLDISVYASDEPDADRLAHSWGVLHP